MSYLVKNIQVLVFILLTSFLTSCGGGGGGGGSSPSANTSSNNESSNNDSTQILSDTTSNTENNSGTQTTSGTSGTTNTTDSGTQTTTGSNTNVKTSTLSGTVIDGEISGATVFLDLNRNGALESNEPSATTDGSGKYVLTLTAEHKAHKNYLNKKAPIVIFGGVDIRTGEAFDDYLTAIIEDENETNVTPLTTLIAETLGEELDADVNETISNIDSKLSEIKKNLSELLEIKEEMLTKNPIELAQEGNVTLIDTSLQIHKVAREMKKAMKSEVKTLRKSILKSYRAVAKSLKKLKKTAIKEGDTALVAALDDALEDNEIFESQFKEAIKEESKEIAKEIKSYWSRNRVALSDADVTTVLNGLEIVIVDANSSIVNDTEAPKIIRLGRKDINVTQGEEYSDRGAIARDNKDGNLTSSIVTYNPVDTDTVGKYTITYNVSDAAGNVATEVQRFINVMAKPTVPDRIKPVITLIGSSSVSVERDSNYVDLGVTAKDNVDGDISGKVIVNNPVDTSKLGTYIVRYNVKDSANNSAIEVQRTVEVKRPVVVVERLLRTANDISLRVVTKSISGYTLEVFTDQTAFNSVGSATFAIYGKLSLNDDIVFINNIDARYPSGSKFQVIVKDTQNKIVGVSDIYTKSGDASINFGTVAIRDVDFVSQKSN